MLRKGWRTVMVCAALAGAGTFAMTGYGEPAEAQALLQSASASTPLDLTRLKQFTQPLANPLNPQTPGVRFPTSGQAVTLTIRELVAETAVRKNGVPLSTRVWGYGIGNQNAIFPGPTFEVNRGSPLTVTYVNGLDGIPNRMPVDTTLDWANPGSLGGRAPVPLVAHLHGGRSQYLSDGLPDAWSTPGDILKGRLFAKPYTYDNNQEAGHLWYHDHTRGITRTNVYMGLAGHYFIRDANEANLQRANVIPSAPYEVAIVIQDRQFKSDGDLLYPASDPTNRSLPKPTHLPEFFGDAILVNGTAWPRMTVEQRKYRFRILDGSDSRFYGMKLQREATQPGGPSTPTGSRLELMVIGNELGFLNSPVEANWFAPADPTASPTPQANQLGGGIMEPDMLLIGPGERYDVVIDFSHIAAGTRIVLWNDAPTPYNGQVADGADYVAPTPGLSDRIMAFDVVARSARPDATVALGTPLRRTDATPPLPRVAKTGVPVRKILLVEGTDVYGRLQTMLGKVGSDPRTQGTFNFRDPVTEQPVAGTSEIWEFHNTTADVHPIHMHLIDFRIIDRQPFIGTVVPKTNTDGSIGGNLTQVSLVGPPIPAGPSEAGKKDTALSYPGHITRVLVNFIRAGEYVYHCHILSHEDHEMMRPYVVVDKVASQ